MQNFKDRTNNVLICGKVQQEAGNPYEVRGEKFYEITVEIPRLSGQLDVLPVTISERLASPDMLRGGGGTICVIGQFRSYNKIVDGKSRLLLSVFARQILDEPISKNPNQIFLAGYICKPPVYRTTPFNREITDLLIAVNRQYGKSDYIPLIVWGRNANFAGDLSVGDRIIISGRIQSRDYQKATDSGIEVRTAYEVSVSSIAMVDTETEMNTEYEQLINHSYRGLCE